MDEHLKVPGAEVDANLAELDDLVNDKLEVRSVS
jgi:hypothetical protein